MSAPASRVVIAGASHAGVALADALRRQGYSGEVVLLSDEAHAPYQRPLLSKSADFLALSSERTSLKQSAFYRDNGIDLQLEASVTGIARDRREVHLDGRTLAYDHLVLAVGAGPRLLPTAITAGVPPLYLRSMNDARNLHGRLASAQRIAVIGGGLIGLEVAALAQAMGRSVTVYEAGASLLGRVVPPELSDWLAQKHHSTGLDIRLSVQIVALRGDEGGYALQLAGENSRHFDVVLVAIGSMPRLALATGAGLATGNGISVNLHGQSSADAIWAIGDCADWGALDGAGQRFEGIQPALEQGRIVAKAITGQGWGDLPVPRYWSHQGALRLQTAGAATPGMVFQTLSAEAGGLCLLGLANGVPSACFAVDAPNAYRDAVKLVEAARMPEMAAPVATAFHQLGT